MPITIHIIPYLSQNVKRKSIFDFQKLKGDVSNFTPQANYDLSTNNNIVEGNALRIDWNDIVSNQNLNYIMGNPPFIGARKKTKEQKKDLEIIFGKKTKKIGDLDYVVGWYKKADEYIKDTNITCAFVSTNSITQGEQPYILWSNLSDKFFQFFLIFVRI